MRNMQHAVGGLSAVADPSDGTLYCGVRITIWQPRAFDFNAPMGASEDEDFIGFFFFQAEDGIRDYKVTGVQTCALPILPTTRTITPATRRPMASVSSTSAPPTCGSTTRRATRRGASRSKSARTARRRRARDRKSVV